MTRLFLCRLIRSNMTSLSKNQRLYNSSHFLLLIFGMILCLNLGGCSSSSAKHRDGAQLDSEGRMNNVRGNLAGAPAPQAAYADEAMMSESSAPPMQKMSSIHSTSRSNSPLIVESNPEPVASKSRMVHYQGHASLRSTDPEKAVDSAIQIAKLAGGYLENRTGLYVSLRVPTAQFDSLFVRIMRLGEVVSFSQEAEDITEAYNDVDLRFKLVEATLQRLEALVQKAKTDNQKLMLLGELKRLREEREVLLASKSALAQKAQFAAIHLQLLGHTPEVNDGELKKDLADFQWIRQLGPFDENRFKPRCTLRFNAPEGMVVSNKSRPWRATGSQGAQFWGSALEVKPMGDASFWNEAIRTRLKQGFKAVDTLESGGYRFCKFQSYGATPYFYWVGVNPDGDKLRLVELYFPNEAQQTQHLPAILASVQKGPVSWYSLF
jgi:Domain of unknown function (DUF4349)